MNIPKSLSGVNVEPITLAESHADRKETDDLSREFDTYAYANLREPLSCRDCQW